MSSAAQIVAVIIILAAVWWLTHRIGKNVVNFANPDGMPDDAALSRADWNTPASTSTTSDLRDVYTGATTGSSSGLVSWLNDFIFGGFMQTQPTEIHSVTFNPGDCVNLAQLTGDPSFASARFSNGQFYDTKYTVVGSGGATSEHNGRFQYSTASNRRCWVFIGDVDKSCGEWQFTPVAQGTCPFPEADCRAMKAFYGDNHDGPYTSPSGNSYLRQSDVIHCMTR